MLIKPKAGQPAKIKVVGVGGGGGNAIASMIKGDDLVGVEFVAVNTDAQALLNQQADIKIQIGDKLTKGLGSGGDPEIGLKAAEESINKIKENLSGADMIFVTCGQGGGTGTGASPIIAQIGRETGALTVAVVTKPFDFEGSKRRVIAEEGIERLKDKVDTLIVIPNQRVLEIIDNKVSVLEAFAKIDSILHQGVKGIAELITTPGLINVDFADVRAIMSNAGTALMGMGTGSGEKRALAAIKQSISSPLLEVSIEGAKGILFNIIGGPELSMKEVDEAASIIAKTADSDADIIFGAVIDDKMMDQVKVTLIATKFDEGRLRLRRFKDKIKPLEEKVEKEEEKKNQKPAKKKPLPKEEKVADEELFEEESEFDVPTFLRRR